MKFLPFLPKSNNHGFTMIELLIVIAILGILAVAVLSAINPVEQINRGRDTGLRSDAEQVLSAIDRYEAFQSYKPWMRSAADLVADTLLPFTPIENTNWVDSANNSDCPVLAKLAGGKSGAATQPCAGTNELKDSFLTRISEDSYRGLYIYQGTNLAGNALGSTYVCFVPSSQAFVTEATARCGVAGAGLPEDIDNTVAAGLCGDGSLNDKLGAAIKTPMVCLP